jgi:CheY-like chemotaxis protein
VTAPIEVVRDGNQAIAYLNGEGVYADRNLFPLPSALFLDLVMPRADGFQVLKWLKTQSAFDNMLVIVLTNYSEGRLLRDAYAMGADSFLFKPFTKADLESLMQHFPDGWTKSTTGPGVPVQR